jgi:hypothetical protein
MMDNTYAQQKHQNTYNCYGDEALTQTTQCYGASAIGDGAFLHLDDHVNGLSTLARLGNAIPRTYILKVTDATNKVIHQWTQPKPNQVVKADAAFIVDNMASDPKASYLPGSCTATDCTSLAHGGYKFQRFQGWDFAVKTGTTNDGYDGLMTSWSSKYAVVSWVGNHSRNVNLNTTMENLTEPLTRGWMEYAHTNVKVNNWVQPATIKTAPAFVLTKHVHFGDVEPSPATDLYPGWYAGGVAKSNTSQTTDKVSGKVATSCTPALAKQIVTNGNAAFWNIDIFNGGKANIATNSSATGSTVSAPTDDVHNCSDSPPVITLNTPDTCDTSCTITATVTQGTHLLTDPLYASYPGTVSFTLNGQTIKTQYVSDSPSTVSFVYNPTSSGTANLTATVTDSVLYQGTDSGTINLVSAPVASPQLTLLGNTSGADTIFNWSGGTGPFSLSKNGTFALTGCTNISGNTCKNTGQAPKNTSVTIKDSAGATATTTVN